MAATRLTDLAIERTRARAGDIEVKDAGAPGLYVRVRTSGRKTFVLKLRRFDPAKGGRATQVITLGDWPAYTLKKARAEAFARSAKTPAIAPRYTVAEALEEHRRAHEDEGPAERRWREQTRASYATYRRYLVERVGKRPLADVRRDELASAFRAYAERGRVAANRLASFTITFFGWALGEGWIDDNPAARLGDRQKQPGGREESRARVLGDAEIVSIWRLEHSNAPLLRALLLTGCRIRELQRASVDHLDGDWLRIPEDHSKNRRAHRVYLVPAARAQFDGRSPLLFRAVSATSVQAWARRAQMHINRNDEPREPWASLRPRDAVSGAPVAAWTPHDLRRTFVTLAARAGVPEHIIVRLVNQTPVTRELSATLGTYQRHEYLEERRQATLAVAALVREIVGG
jgi:integrase